MSHRNLSLLLAVSMLSYACYVRAERNPYARYISSGFQIIDRYALQQPADQALFNGAMRGMVDVLRANDDLHSQFIPAARRDAEVEDIRQEFAGVGIVLQIMGEPPTPTVFGPPEPGSPAKIGGIQAGDRIIKVDGQPSSEFDLDGFTKAVRGPVGETVTLTVQRDGTAEPIDIPLVRGIVNVPSIRGDLRDDAGEWVFRLADRPGVGYIRITKFGDKTAAEVETALAKLVAEGVDGVILDVRDNPGGVLDAAVNICDLFLKAGLPIVSTRDRDGRVLRRETSTEQGNFLDIPVAVLINGDSASASEIVAACLQDWNRAVVVGQRSYGKGTVQTIMRLESGRSELRITSATYWRPSNQNIHRMPDDGPDDQWGVMPTTGFEASQDDELAAARRRWRLVRDVVGVDVDSPLAAAVIEQIGEIPEGLVDPALQKAAAYLQNPTAP